MKPHLRYLRYVLLHKWYVLRAGLAIRHPLHKRYPGEHPLAGLAWLWRLLVHDLSKFRPSEWRPYVAKFYGSKINAAGGIDGHGVVREINARFDHAWMLHIHRNPHHWQYWILHEDSGKTIVKVIPLPVAEEMLADWIGAGTKILARPSLALCIAETVLWYGQNYPRMMIRGEVRAHIEVVLADLAAQYVPIADRPEVRRTELVTLAGPQ